MFTPLRTNIRSAGQNGEGLATTGAGAKSSGRTAKVVIAAPLSVEERPLATVHHRGRLRAIHMIGSIQRHQMCWLDRPLESFARDVFGTEQLTWAAWNTQAHSVTRAPVGKPARTGCCAEEA